MFTTRYCDNRLSTIPELVFGVFSICAYEISSENQSQSLHVGDVFPEILMCFQLLALPEELNTA